ncbi:membrane protein required for colicin V production [Sphaerotilus hippei]|uniref:Membrane protein required for colicin V production n=1 Tax=Sphaerotilus hippei TaxID=744406 RepID=A0A318H502_9BURK|nr:CvpA family protein [Sphaerotilus hippei]PXW98766.1 membrane protein required for colicin V production [Sphaerotilus hippei]
MMLDAWLWPDWFILLVLLGSMVWGVMRGLVFELLSVASWVLAWIAAQWWALPVAQRLSLGADGSVMQRSMGFVLVFVLALVLLRLLTWLVSQLIHATPLAGLDRLFGAAFGLVRGLLIVLAAVMVLEATPLARGEGWSRSVAVGWSKGLLSVVGPVFRPRESS